MSSSTPSILKPGPMTWLISSARPALESVSHPVPGDQSDSGCSLIRNSKSPAFVGDEAMAKMPAFSAPISRICTYWPATVKASAAPSAGLIVIALRPSAASLMLPTSSAVHTGSGPQPQMTRLVREGARAPPSWTVRTEPPSCRAATEPRPRIASVTFISPSGFGSSS